MPMTRTVIGMVVLLSLVWLAEAFDIGIVGPVLKALKDGWHLTEAQMGLLGVASTAGVVVGMIPSGVIADRFGRRKVVLLGIAVFSVITLS
ncbi:MAG: MFS transporter, partial [Alicyclobacillus sp.]|nr:MFS transporter [Alicyclobacillus sp.]